MCGIAGIWFSSPESAASLEGIARRMSDAMRHRGPDDSGTWADEAAGLALGHRRLAILDLSPRGHQPMFSACGRYVMVYNGEVYNHLELRSELEAAGYAFQGGSDTETLLAACAEWGLAATVKRCIGMFALALWDRKSRSLSLVRDRLGIKPLYYGRVGNAFAFGSEIKALRAIPNFSCELDRDALALYFRHNYIPAPHSIHQGIQKLEPGCILTLEDVHGAPRIAPFWSVQEVWSRAGDSPFTGSEDEALERLEALLLDAVRTRLLADVPLGSFLSGGIDSSLVAALMQACSTSPVKTFSIGFQERAFDESAHARAVAAHLGTDHTELMVTPGDMLRAVPDIAQHWDEPFSDSSQLPTLCVCALARKSVTVALSGDGGDELFGGYQRYLWGAHWRQLSRIPLPLRRALARAGRLLPEGSYRLLGPNGPKIRWRLDGLASANFPQFYRFLLSHHKDPARFVLGATEPATLFNAPEPPGDGLMSTMRYLDLRTYLPDDILTKVDRASMAVSLEARVPLLDHRVVEFAATLPENLLLRGGQGKYLLRRLLHKYVPKQLVERPKMGFGVPIEHWLGHELRDWCEELLDEQRIREQGYLDVRAVRSMWRDFLGGQSNWHYYLWDVLMFQAWLERWENGA